MSRPTTVSFSLAASSANNIALSQTPGGAGNLTLNGAAVTGGAATLDNPRVVGITSAGNDSSKTFTITGTDASGQVISEAVTGANIGVASSVNNFKTVTQIAVSGATAAAITVGTTAVGASTWLALDYIQDPFSVGLGCVVTGTVTYTVQHTFDEPFVQGVGQSSGVSAYVAPTAFPHPFLVTQTASKDGNYAVPVRATRIQINSGTGTVAMTVLQGTRGG